MKQTNYVLTLKAEDRPGLLPLVTGLIEKRQLPIKSLSYAQTDIHDVLLITIEVISGESELAQLALKLENIVEVYTVEVKEYDSAVCLRAAYFKMAKTFLGSPKAIALSNYDAVIVNIRPDHFLLAKYGTDATIQKLYRVLDGKHLLGFSQTGLITDSGLIGDEQSRVQDEIRIIRLAA